MRRALLSAALSIGLAAIAPALAAPRVATDIAPVQALAARVMAGVGAPDLLLPPGASPHGYQMRPSAARALAGANVVFWVGPELTPWLEKALAALAGDARTVALLAAKTTIRRRRRATADFEDGHDHDGHRDDRAAIDPHAWLDPDNGKAWLSAMAAALAAADPANAARYRQNAADGRIEIDALAKEIQERLAPLGSARFVVFHDAFQYFERRFGLNAIGAIALGDGGAPGPRRLSDIRRRIAASRARCVFAEPQFPAKLIRTATAGTGARTALLDPIGIDLPPGAGLYPAVLKRMAAAFADCLGR